MDEKLNEYHCPGDDDELDDETEHCGVCCIIITLEQMCDRPDWDEKTQWDGGCGRFVCEACHDELKENKK